MNQLRKCVLYAPKVANSAQAKIGYPLWAQNKIIKKYVLKNDLEIKKAFPVLVDKNKRSDVIGKMLTFVKNNNINIIAFADFAFLTPYDTLAVNDWLMEEPNREIYSIMTNTRFANESSSADIRIWDMKVHLARSYFECLSKEKAT